MLKLISFVLIFLITGSWSLRAPAAAPVAASIAQETFDEDINKDLLDSELGPSADDVPPPAEYPYPGAKEEGINPEDAPKTAQAPQPAPNLEIQRPKSIDEDTGEYHYETKVEPPAPVQREGDHNPVKVKENGEYEYSTELTPPAFVGHEGAEKPLEIRANGEYKYATESTPTTAAASFRLGLFGPPPPALRNEATTRKTTFKDIYLKDQYPVLFFDYEWPLARKLGHLGIKFGSGLFIANGQGQFAAIDSNRRADDIPLERYTFFMLPNMLTAQYRFQFKEAQTLVPYVEGGAGYFTFAEFRDDNASPRVGGALTSVVAGGLNILMDWADPQAVRNLDLEYGINHVFLTLEARQIVGLNKSYDFTSMIYNAGFLLQF